MPRGRKPGSKNKPKDANTSIPVNTPTNTSTTTPTTTTTTSKTSKSTSTSSVRSAPVQVNNVGEVCVTYIAGEDVCYFYGTTRWARSFIQESLKEHPDECKVMIREDDGTPVQITIPAKAIKYIRWPTKKTFSDEQIEAARERVKKAQEARRKVKEETKGEVN